MSAATVDPPAHDHVTDASEGGLLPIADGPRARRAAWSLLRGSRGRAAVTVAVITAATGSGLLVPPLLGAIVNTVTDDAPSSRIDTIAVALAVIVIAQAVLRGAATVLVASLGERLLAELREEVAERALALPLGDVERAPAGDLVSRVSGDVTAVSDAARSAIPELIVAVFTIGLTLVGLTALDWRLALAALAVVPIHLFATRWYLGRSAPVYASERVALGERTGTLTETVHGARNAIALGLTARRAEAVAETSWTAIDRSLLAARIRSRFFAMLNGAELVGLTSVLVAGYLLVDADMLSLGAATAAALYFQRLFNPFNALLGLLDTAQDAAAAFARLVGITSLPEPAEPADPPTSVDGTVEIDHVTYSYQPGHPVVRDVTLEIADREYHAIVGTSGAGKTTLAKLVAGIHTPDTGTIRLGRTPIDALGPAATRRTVALVTQDTHVFAATIADNVRLACPDVTDDDVNAAIERVGAHHWVAALPDGIHTIVGDGGHPLGPLEAQHVAMARLALHPAHIVVLDEATAEAGSAGARTLETAATAAIGDRTAIVIAHRLTQAVHADRICVMADGTVTQRGTHDELARAPGPYAELWHAWTTPRHEA